MLQLDCALDTVSREYRVPYLYNSLNFNFSPDFQEPSTSQRQALQTRSYTTLTAKKRQTFEDGKCSSALRISLNCSKLRRPYPSTSADSNACFSSSNVSIDMRSSILKVKVINRNHYKLVTEIIKISHQICPF